MPSEWRPMAATQRVVEWLILPAIPAGQIGARSDPTGMAIPGSPRWRMACLAQMRPAVNSCCRLFTALVIAVLFRIEFRNVTEQVGFGDRHGRVEHALQQHS